jgi:cobalt-zinc-cadmium efflux system outer membrane protein
MYRKARTSARLRRAGLAAVWTAVAWAAQAQTPPSALEPADLPQAFERAWARQPEALSLPTRRDAALAQQRAAQSWTPEPAALELSNKSDRLTRNRGVRELEVGVAVPLWLPGERDRSAALADAEGAAIESRATAAQLRVAGAVREAWWQWQRARIDALTARAQLESAVRLADDVARRLKAGDLARADQHQADGAVAAAASAMAQADAGLAAARQQLRSLAGGAPPLVNENAASPEPVPDAGPESVDGHAALQELRDRAAVAERTAALAATRSRANPELTLATTRERSIGESSQQTVTVGVRIPFGAGARHDGRIAQSLAEAAEAQAQVALEQERLAAERDSARVRFEGARLQLAAAERRAQLARESRGFFDKSFRLGETDLPTRLRIEAEAAEAERQASRSRVEVAAAISSWRQALGLLPR